MVLKHRNSIVIRITIANCDRNVLDWVAVVTGVGVIIAKSAKSALNRTGYTYQANSEAAESVIRKIRPYLHIKGAQADLCLESQKRLRDPALKADRSWQTEYAARSQAMNKRGPRGNP